MEKQRLGSTRIIRPVSRGFISQQYTDRWSAFDRGPSAQEIPGIGVARCACAIRSFTIAHRYGIHTHFLRQHGPVTFYAREHAVPGQESLSGKTHGRVVDAEWIWRALVKGSLLERIKSGQVDPVSLGFAPGTVVTDGMKLPCMIKECTTKFEKVDRPLTDDQARERVNMTFEQWEATWRILERIVYVLNEAYERAGFSRADGKMEVAITTAGDIEPVDVFGTPDEDRIFHTKTGELYCKDLIRDYLKGLPWHDQLKEAKAAYPDDKSRWPAYPILPDSLVRLVSKRYTTVADKYGII